MVPLLIYHFSKNSFFIKKLYISKVKHIEHSYCKKIYDTFLDSSNDGYRANFVALYIKSIGGLYTKRDLETWLSRGRSLKPNCI